ncbi:Oligoribonuclease [Lawsonella clevelandensis]|uniref:Oligoribonuclease n=2 Tax=Lawsonella clevelandensis TaxID=1528099 RepID=A0A5E3ZYN3_9ACTN|nr:Oligoribonuclease [Lawsonella clevelandensis]
MTMISPDNLPAKLDRIVWIDCEMTGLDRTKDVLVEISVLVTDGNLRVLGGDEGTEPGLDIVIHASDELLNGMDEVVTEMHAKSGLTDEIRRSTITVAEAEQQVLAYIMKFVDEPRTAPLAGNSIATDRAFIARDMPELDAFLHYRMIDVSTIKELCHRWFPRIYINQPPKGMNHRAMADIKESIKELAYYRAVAFVPSPGPSDAEIKGKLADFS